MNGPDKLEYLLLASFSKPSLMFVGKARSLIFGEATERYFTRVGYGTVRLQCLAMKKHSSLLQAFLNYESKGFYNIRLF
jgi:hypothetical protein